MGSKLMTKAEYDRMAAANPGSPSWEVAKANVVKQLIGQAVRGLDSNEAPQQVAGYLSGAIAVLLEGVN
jgi:hypothetical protein